MQWLMKPMKLSFKVRLENENERSCSMRVLSWAGLMARRTWRMAIFWFSSTAQLMPCWRRRERYSMNRSFMRLDANLTDISMRTCFCTIWLKSDSVTTVAEPTDSFFRNVRSCPSVKSFASVQQSIRSSSTADSICSESTE